MVMDENEKEEDQMKYGCVRSLIILIKKTFLLFILHGIKPEEDHLSLMIIA